MNTLVLITIGAFALGQLGAISLGNTITLYLHDIFAAVLLLYALISKKISSNGSLTRPILIFAAVAVISLIVNYHRFSIMQIEIALLYLVRWIVYSVLYFIAFKAVNPSKRWLIFLYWYGVAVAALGLVQYVYYPYLRNLSYLGWDPHLFRVFSTFFDPNYLSIFLVLTLFLGMYYVSKMKWYFFAGQLVTFVAFCLTYSRSGYVAFIVGLFVYALFMRKLKVFLVGIFLFIAILFMLPKADGEGVKLFRTVSTFARVGNWERGFVLIKDAPIFGYGFNTLRYVQEQRGWVTDKNGVPSKAGAGLDDSFQFLWATTGILGLLSYIWILVRMGKIFVRLLNNGNTRVLGVIGISTLIATIIHSQFINSLFYPQILMWWFIVAGASEQTLIMAGTSRAVQPSSGSPHGRWRRLSKGFRRRIKTQDT